MNLDAPSERLSSHSETLRSRTRAVNNSPKKDPRISNGSEISSHTWISYLNVTYPMTRSQPKEINLRVRPSSLRKRGRSSQKCQPQAQVKLLNLGMRSPKSEMEMISPSVPTIPLAKPIGHGNARAARHRETILERKQDQKQHPPDAPTASIIQGCRRIR